MPRSICNSGRSHRRSPGSELGHLPGITGWTFGHHGIVGIGGHVIPAIGLAAGKGPLLSPTLLQGRPPRTGDEIVLGTATLRQIGRHVGQTVTMTVGGRPLRERIVGRVVFPNFGQGSFTPTDLGQGAQTTAAVLKPPPGAAPGFRLRAAALHTRPTPGREHRQLPAVHDRVLPDRPAVHMRGHQPAPQRRHQLRQHRPHSRGPRRVPRCRRHRGARPVHRGVGTAAAP